MKQLVYAMRDRNTQLIKIGISVDPTTRVEGVAKQFGADVELLGTLEVEDARKVEQFLHGALSAHRIMGEWFRPDTKTLSYILAFFNKSEQPPEVQPKQKVPRRKALTPPRKEKRFAEEDGELFEMLDDYGAIHHKGIWHLAHPWNRRASLYAKDNTHHNALAFKDMSDLEVVKRLLVEIEKRWESVEEESFVRLDALGLELTAIPKQK